MSKKTNKKVIKNKGRKKDVSNKLNFFQRIFNFLKKHVKVTILSFIGIILLFIVLFIISIFVRTASLNKVVLKIDDMEYTKSDFMIYFYSVKYDYFGKEANNLSDDNLKIIVDEENKTTLGEYLKNKALSEVKTATVIKEYASKNNISLDEDDYKELKNDKKKYIKSIGGNSKFKKLLRDNNTTEKSYDDMAANDKLYEKIIKKLYSEGKRKDLTEEELSDAKNTYKDNYFKIEQVILTTIDVETKKSLSDTTINQKKTLADTIYESAKAGKDFDKLVSKYSEGAVDKEPPYYEYYKKGELLKELEEAIVKLGDNDISKVIQTNYAFHIIKKLKLDDSKFNDYLDKLREEKALKDLNEALDSLKVIYRDAYKKIKY